MPQRECYNLDRDMFYMRYVLKRVPQVLYRIFDHDGELLYVGISKDPYSRLRAHEVQRWWWPEANIVQIERFNTRDAVQAAETAAIVTECPRYNIRGKDQKRDRDAAHKLAIENDKRYRSVLAFVTRRVNPCYL